MLAKEKTEEHTSPEMMVMMMVESSKGLRCLDSLSEGPQLPQGRGSDNLRTLAPSVACKETPRLKRSQLRGMKAPVHEPF